MANEERREAWEGILYGSSIAAGIQCWPPLGLSDATGMPDVMQVRYSGDVSVEASAETQVMQGLTQIDLPDGLTHEMAAMAIDKISFGDFETDLDLVICLFELFKGENLKASCDSDR